MHNKVSTVILSDNEQTSTVLKMYVEEFGNSEMPVIFSNNNDVTDFLNNHENVALIMDLSKSYESGIEYLCVLLRNYPDCKVLVLADEPSVDLIVKSVRAGAKEFLTLPLIKSEFFEVYNNLINSFDNAKNPESKCKIISVFSNKGGIGKTTIASNLALGLANLTKEKVALIDLNFQLGDVTTFLDLRPSFNISYMLQNLDKINEDFLLSTLERYKQSSLYVLADPPYFKQADNISPAQISRLFKILKETFSYIIVDAESSFDAKNIAALTESDLIFLITVANLPALRNSQRCLELFSKLGFDDNKVQILLNRYMENDEVSEKDVETLTERKVFWKIPNNYFTLMSAINKGIPVCELNPESNIAKNYNDLALYLTDKIYRENVSKRYENRRLFWD